MPAPVSLALFQPEIPANAGTLIRSAACLDFALHIIGPTGFVMTDKALRRAGLDYRDKAMVSVHSDFDEFSRSLAWNPPRLVLATTKATLPYVDFSFRANDIVVMGRETSGAPQWLHDRADERVLIPMMADRRSLNMALAAGLIMGEALRQTDSFPTADEGSQ
ncbi:MAG: tRNA (cytidine(34)-2'-O)-methyltransferase [Cohaesibacteraceae bacterium]